MSIEGVKAVLLFLLFLALLVSLLLPLRSLQSLPPLRRLLNVLQLEQCPSSRCWNNLKKAGGARYKSTASPMAQSPARWIVLKDGPRSGKKMRSMTLLTLGTTLVVAGASGLLDTLFCKDLAMTRTLELDGNFDESKSERDARWSCH